MSYTTEQQTLAAAFVDVLREWLDEEQFQQMKERNATPEYEGCCASHDFCDANMAMHEAWIGLLGREPAFLNDSDDEASQALWNAAWEIARKGELTASA